MTANTRIELPAGRPGGERQRIKDGGEVVVEAGGEIRVEDGGTVNLEAGSELNIDGVQVTADAGELNKLDGAGGNVTAANLNALTGGGDIAAAAGGHGHELADGATDLTVTAAQVDLLMQGLAAGYQLARGVHETVAAEDVLVTGLAAVVAIVATLADDPSVDPLLVTADVGDQAGAPAAGSVYIRSWKPTANDNVTPIAATTFGKKVNWVAIGT